MFVAIYSTFDNIVEAKRISRKLIAEKLVACVNLVPNVVSIMWCKTCEEKVEKIKSVIEKHHSYDVPAFVVYPIKTGSEAYLQWIIDETKTS
jgi:periplasmic divalent cation tolerance protein